jgi:hypothetical protein
MKKRFDHNEEPDDDDDEFEQFLEEQEEMEQAFAMGEELILVERQLNVDILLASIELAKKSFLWRFRRFQTKLKMVSEIYQNLKILTEPNRNANEL